MSAEPHSILPAEYSESRNILRKGSAAFQNILPKISAESQSIPPAEYSTQDVSRVSEYSHQQNTYSTQDVSRISSMPAASQNIRPTEYFTQYVSRASEISARIGIPTTNMLDALCEHLLEKPGLYQYKMVDFVWNHFQVYLTTSSIRRALVSHGWSKKKIGRVAKARNTDLRDLYLYNTSAFCSYHYMFVDESG